MLDDGSEVQGYCGAYGVDDSAGSLVQKMTPARATIAEVVDDLKAARHRQKSLRLAQIIDLRRLEPVEPARATLARLD